MTTVPYENKKISASPVAAVSHLLPLRFVIVGAAAATTSSVTASSGTPSRSPVAVSSIDGGRGMAAPASTCARSGVSTAVAVVVSPSDPELRHLTDVVPLRDPRAIPPRPPTPDRVAPNGALCSGGAAGGGSGRPYE